MLNNNVIKIDFKLKQKLASVAQKKANRQKSKTLNKDTATLRLNVDYFINGKIAAVVGRGPANLVNHITCSINSHIGDERFFKDGLYWMYDTYEALAKKFNVSLCTIRKWIHKLKATSFIIVRQLNKATWDRTNYFAIKADEYNAILDGEIAPKKKKRRAKPKTAEEAQPTNNKDVNAKEYSIDRVQSTQSIGYKVPTPSLSNISPEISNKKNVHKELVDTYREDSNEMDCTFEDNLNSLDKVETPTVPKSEQKDIPYEAVKAPPLNEKDQTIVGQPIEVETKGRAVSVDIDNVRSKTIEDAAKLWMKMAGSADFEKYLRHANWAMKFLRVSAYKIYAMLSYSMLLQDDFYRRNILRDDFHTFSYEVAGNYNGPKKKTYFLNAFLSAYEKHEISKYMENQGQACL